MSSTPSGHGESLVAILDELTDLVASARAMPMSASALINRAEVLELVDSAKAVLPGQISQADDVIADADAVLDRARRDAGRILERAKARAEELVSTEHVVTEAQARAERILEEARVAAETLSREADDYCDRQLAQFEIDLGAVSTQVAAGRARLLERARSRGDQTGPDDRAAPRSGKGQGRPSGPGRASARPAGSAPPEAGAGGTGERPTRTPVAERGTRPVARTEQEDQG